MWSAASVVVCALSLLGRSADSLPPIAFVDIPPPGVSRQADAFVLGSQGTIYLVTSAGAFDAVLRSRFVCGDRFALAKVASIIVHEEWHIKHGPDERQAYEAQMMALRFSLGVSSDTTLFQSVRAAMQAALRDTPSTHPRADMTVALEE